MQPFAEGVTTTVATTGTLPLLVAVKEGILPLPDAARPMLVVVFVQSNCVPATVPTKVVAAVKAVLHNAWSAGSATVGVGFTLIVKVLVVPVQPNAVGVTFTVDTIVDAVLLVAVKEAISVLPEVARPVLVLLFVHE